MPISVYVTLGSGVHVQLFRSSGQSEVELPNLSSEARFVLIYRPIKMMSRTCPSCDLNPGAVVWKRGTPALSHCF
ncbi:hypothetical protein TNCV_1760771 [Trichonephila clavipes]|nr:hypothetical protein TNCV_1760771 [Trichonephila clavipes]